MNQAKYDSLPADLKKVIDANSGIETSKMIGEAFDATTEPAKKLARDAGGTLDTLSPVEYEKWLKATEPVAKDWVQEAGAKGANGQQLLDDAKAQGKALWLFMNSGKFVYDDAALRLSITP